MPNASLKILRNHRFNQYRQDVCFTKDFMIFCAKNNLSAKNLTRGHISCFCPSDLVRCSSISFAGRCPEAYEKSRNSFLGEETPLTAVEVGPHAAKQLYRCACPPDPCATKDFYNQCRIHEAMNMHPVDAAEAEIRLHPNGYPEKYRLTELVTRLTALTCLCSPLAPANAIMAFPSSW